MPKERKPWTLTERLEELERTDPAVRAARERLDDVMHPFTRAAADIRRQVWATDTVNRNLITTDTDDD